tara:strand:+ start:447 stop:686 length:240 start_codon:yes stop_codon:yes gene_type:complete
MGKDEKSMGVAVCIATIMINSAKMMLKVKKTSSSTGGIGSTSKLKTSNTIIGITSELSGKILSWCRKFVNVKSDKSISY